MYKLLFYLSITANVVLLIVLWYKIYVSDFVKNEMEKSKKIKRFYRTHGMNGNDYYR